MVSVGGGYGRDSGERGWQVYGGVRRCWKCEACVWLGYHSTISNLGIPSSVPTQPASAPSPHIPNSVPSSSQQPPRVDDTPHPSDPFNPSLDAYYEDQNPDPTPWHVVNHTKPSFAQAASSAPSHGPSGPRIRPQRKTPFSNNQKWILRFPPKDKPSEGT